MQLLKWGKRIASTGSADPLVGVQRRIPTGCLCHWSYILRQLAWKLKLSPRETAIDGSTVADFSLCLGGKYRVSVITLEGTMPQQEQAAAQPHVSRDPSI
ncbi:hypothetical protein HS088_TW12G00178 [Tripterygium wilfordii]|uniref:Uncharacterized protein n=1 Tax=Tripterygium wilfordii TaxID=458696 RepID=A0A7J7CY11_TRIWF|nr:hypothetical protein HS088_TW12G00178 [Tripterygium wilfordii]